MYLQPINICFFFSFNNILFDLNEGNMIYINYSILITLPNWQRIALIFYFYLAHCHFITIGTLHYSHTQLLFDKLYRSAFFFTLLKY